MPRSFNGKCSDFHWFFSIVSIFASNAFIPLCVINNVFRSNNNYLSKIPFNTHFVYCFIWIMASIFFFFFCNFEHGKRFTENRLRYTNLMILDNWKPFQKVIEIGCPQKMKPMSSQFIRLNAFALPIKRFSFDLYYIYFYVFEKKMKKMLKSYSLRYSSLLNHCMWQPVDMFIWIVYLFFYYNWQ